MHVGEVTAPEIPFEMSFRKKKAEQIVTGFERQINYHLLKLYGFEAAPETREHWKAGLDEWLAQIAVIKLQPDNKPISARLAFEWLYDEPFGGGEEQAAAIMLGFLARRGLTRNAEQPAAIVTKVRAFHEAVARRIARNDTAADVIAGL